MEGEPDWISRMAEEQVIIRQTSGEEADRSSSEDVPEEDTVNTKETGEEGVSKIAQTQNHLNQSPKKDNQRSAHIS